MIRSENSLKLREDFDSYLPAQLQYRNENLSLKRVNHYSYFPATRLWISTKLVGDLYKVKGYRWTKFSFSRKNSKKLIVWGAISLQGNSALNFCKKSIDSAEYQRTLNNFMCPMIDIFYPDGCEFQQDNAPCHVSKSTKEFMRLRNIHPIGWPPNSPDLNPIENVWELMKTELSMMIIKDYDDLAQKIEILWANLTHEYLTSLINSMKDRLESCIKNQGYETEYWNLHTIRTHQSSLCIPNSNSNSEKKSSIILEIIVKFWVTNFLSGTVSGRYLQ